MLYGELFLSGLSSSSSLASFMLLIEQYNGYKRNNERTKPIGADSAGALPCL